MSKQLRKIAAMHDAFGIDPGGHYCADCCCLSSNTQSRRWYKCLRYGVSSATSTDWRVYDQACGMFNVPFDPQKENAMIDQIKHAPRLNPSEPLPGQISIASLEV